MSVLESTATRKLDPMLRPRSVVVVGASPNPSFSSSIFKNLLHCGFMGQVAAVNPRYDRILDAPCYRSVLDVPWPIDLAVVGINWGHVPSLLAECEQKHVGALAMLTSGYAETGEAGAQRQAELSAWSDRTGIPICGPNCLGLAHMPTGMMALPSSFARLVPGNVGLILQSGMMAPSLLGPLFARNIGVTFAITTGNEASADLADFMSYLAADDDTHVIGCFAEQIKSPTHFAHACEEAARREKPIVMLKIGRSEASQRSARAHTGSLVGSDAVVDAALRKLGVTRVRSLDEMFEALAVFHQRRLPRGNGLAAISVSGGASGLLSDLALDCGVRFTPLPEATSAELKTVVPEFGSVGNPLDVTGQGVFQTELLERSLDLLATATGIDAIVYARSFQAWMDADTPLFRTLTASIERHPEVPLIALSLAGGHFMASSAADTPVSAPVDRLDGVPFLQGAEYGLKAVAAFMRYAAFQRSRRAQPAGRSSAPDAAATATRILEGATGSRLTTAEGSTLLRAYGMPLVEEAFAATADAACAQAQRIGFPVAVKVEAPSLAHKARAGGVVLGASSVEQVRHAFEQVMRAADDAQGVMVQQQVQDALAEVIVGMSRDPQFGPVIACGVGGVLVEALRDVQLLLPPVRAEEARAALGRLRGAALLEHADVEALVDVIVRFSELCLDLGSELQAIDINPVLVRPTGAGVCVVDSLFEKLDLT